MFDFDDIALNMQTKYYCSILSAIAGVATVAGAVSAVSGALNSVTGGGGSSGGSSSGVGAAPARNVPTISSQTPLDAKESVAAKTYDPTAQMNSWTSIFSNAIAAPKTAQIEMPKASDMMPNIDPEQSNNPSPV